MVALSNKRWITITVTLLFALLSVVYLFPLYWMVVLGTHTLADIYKFPPPFLPGAALGENFQHIIETFDITRAVGNSLFVACTQTALVLFACSLAGYGFARFHQAPGHRWLFTIMLGTIMIPPVVGLIPWFVEMRQLGWINTHWPLIIPPAANAFGIFWMRQYIEEAIPTELYDAARIDGCSDWKIYWRIVLPLIGPGLSALAALTFLNAWNNFLQPLLVLNNEELFTLPLAITMLRSVFITDLPAVMLATTIGTLPIVIVFILATRQFIMGLSSGSIKG